ncbi:MAG TPA: aminotransferase class IV [Spirochaetota bacterium]|mgnify:FL=1|nr:aminotransferase class IV [Spirochaetota bacterium]HOH36730.1 aminotransferase class IV [Spirochaetota bacterium]HPY04363.1 aminotransferase class IV [Spirochaetota bacterium]HQA52799.1 aminotransferase class IV [Spirochaetota bacterium]
MKNSLEKYPFRFIETVRIENGILCNFESHNARIASTFAKYFPLSDPFVIKDIQLDSVPVKGKYKLRIVYSGDDRNISVEKYAVKKIRSVLAVECSDAEYSFKHEDRSLFSFLKNNDFDEIIVLKKGMVTDSSFSNLAFYDSGKWYTPEKFLLNGTMRQKLLADKIIYEKKIPAEDIKKYEKISFINSMLDLGESCIGTDKIVLN